MDEIKFKISIPVDNDGFVLMQCPVCGNFFKLIPSDFESKTVLEIHCPYCGLASDSYVTEDVIELAQAKAFNWVENYMHKELKKLEKSSNGFIKIKIENNSKPEPEVPIRSGIEALTIEDYECCNKQAKIKPMMKFSSSYCPYCGVKHFGVE